MDVNMLQGMSTLGMIQKISTGNMVIDMVLCMLLPLAFTHLRPYLDQVWQWLSKTSENSMFSRSLAHVRREGYYHYDPSESNHILQEAVMLYIGSRQDLVDKFQSADVKLYQSDRFKTYQDDESDCDWDSDDDAGNIARELAAYKVNTQPPKDEWIEVEDGVHFKKSETVEERGTNGSSRDRHILFSLRSNRKDGHQLIQAFLDRAFQYYTRLQFSKKDKSRYLFMPTKACKDNEDGASTSNMLYKRYKLSNEKTFDGFFHEEKEALLSLVNHFMNKTGKFQILGYPNKLGLLLHGPPGTGKTSLIKALAHYTKRSIVSVPLNKVKTNQELMDIMFDSKFLVQGEELPMKLGHSKVIFVMEDVDACGNVVLRRDIDKSRIGVALTSGNGELDLDAKVAQSVALALSSHGGKENGKSKHGKDAATDGVMHGPDNTAANTKGGTFFKDTSDNLNLAGILNVLDGVVDCPDRIVVMTSNHPDRLDPALIRPGRINKKIYLGYMNARQATLMVQHHFRDATKAELSAFGDAVPLDCLTPAKLEALCAEHDELSSLVAYLDDYSGSGFFPQVTNC